MTKMLASKIKHTLVGILAQFSRYRSLILCNREVVSPKSTHSLGLCQHPAMTVGYLKLVAIQTQAYFGISL